MESNYRLKSYFFIILAIFSIYLLIPSALNFQKIREEAENKAKAAGQPNQASRYIPWYVKLFPNKQVRLGLDLQGGVYLEIDVGLDAALLQRSEIAVGDIERNFKENKIPLERVEVLPKTTHLAVYLKSESDLAKAKDSLQKMYGTKFVQMRNSPVLLFQLKEPNSESAKNFSQQVLQWSKTAQSVRDIQITPSMIEVIVTNPEDKQKVLETFKNKFDEEFSGAYAETQPKTALFYQQSSAYQAEIKKEELERAIETVRRRIDQYGVAEPDIRSFGEERITVEMPGEKDAKGIISKIKEAGNLEFKIVDVSVKEAEVLALVNEAKGKLGTPEIYSSKEVDRINEELKGKIPAESEIAFATSYDSKKKRSIFDRPYLLIKKVEVSGKNLKDARVDVGDRGPYVGLKFNSEGAKAFAEVTTKNVEKPLAILLDGVVKSAPKIDEPITDGSGSISLTGSYGKKQTEAERLVRVLSEGALPAELKIVSDAYVGASLGEIFVRRGFQAIGLAGLTVILFMAFWYKKAGLLADLALVFNLALIFMVLILVGRTLTLPGIAGIVLTIGMAVDANIIILERIKEELMSGRTVKAAVDAGYSNAMSAIIDANITTFLAGVVLFQFGTGPVKGFAVTLMVGILTTMLTAVVVTRTIYDYLINKRQMKALSL